MAFGDPAALFRFDLSDEVVSIVSLDTFITIANIGQASRYDNFGVEAPDIQVHQPVASLLDLNLAPVYVSWIRLLFDQLIGLVDALSSLREFFDLGGTSKPHLLDLYS
jgi:hypothetical protein